MQVIWDDFEKNSEKLDNQMNLYQQNRNINVNVSKPNACEHTYLFVKCHCSILIQKFILFCFNHSPQAGS